MLDTYRNIKALTAPALAAVAKANASTQQYILTNSQADQPARQAAAQSNSRVPNRSTDPRTKSIEPKIATKSAKLVDRQSLLS